MTQTFSSARTSIRQVSKPYKIHLDKFGFEKGATILDFGGGRFDDAKNFMQKYDVKVMVYDPYNRSNEHNRKVISAVMKKTPSYIICANVLNVIKENEVVEDVVKKIKRLAGPNTLCIFSVYEGNGTGHGRQTGPDQYQRNQKTDSYVPMIRRYFPNAIKKYGMIYARR